MAGVWTRLQQIPLGLTNVTAMGEEAQSILWADEFEPFGDGAAQRLVSACSAFAQKAL